MKKISKLKLLLLEQYGSLREASKELEIPYTRLSVLVNDWEIPNEVEGVKINEVINKDDQINMEVEND
jgi:molybdenum-dependent DNA-binding transcriptional regulator ModE